MTYKLTLMDKDEKYYVAVLIEDDAPFSKKGVAQAYLRRMKEGIDEAIDQGTEK